ncbi:MAG TPA: dTDP-4-dehydrorhamnose 3,5-epimerase [Pontiella sp.]
MDVCELGIPDVKLIKPRRFNDGRGFFQQTYQYEQYAAAGIDVRFVQDNWSRSTKGVLRGLHYQFENPQSKLVSVIRGEVFDVAVDMRRSSPTFGQWVGEILSQENGCQLFVPKGFAHGFLVLSDEVDFIYKCDDYYAPGDEYGVIWNDPAIGIEWPDIDVPLVSEKDAVLPLLADAKFF